MAENTVLIRVKKEGDEAVIKRLKELEKLSDKLSQKTIKVKVETKEVEKFATVSRKATDSVKQVAQATEAFGFKIKNAEGLTELLHGKITYITKDFEEAGQAAQKMAGDATQAFAGLDRVLTGLENRVARSLVMSLRGATRDAIQMMKDVDDQLVIVRKVSGATADEVAAIGERAYDTASKYGVAAADYLSSVANFVRAGYRENAESLAELSIKTQMVGDVSEDVADQFLLSTDKAYQFKGSVEDLSRVLDSANELDNKYATSLSKIASGMGIVAPVASQMHVSVEELMASIGTITAVTQRTGTEAARALRAIYLNIVGDTKTEIDEGVTWTTGEIEGLRDVLKKFAPDAVAAAEATGEIINPMKAIEGLAESMKKGIMTEDDIMKMVSDIGGKLRSSQLLALIQNWDMYKDMLEDIEGAAGSADREVQNALDSWSRKTEILRNTWAKFLTNFINSDTFKKIIDKLVDLVEWLDKNHGAVKRLIDVFIAIEAIHLFSRGVRGAMDFANSIQNVIALVTELRAALAGVEGTSMLAKGISGIKGAMASLGEMVPAVFGESGILGALGAILAEFGAIFAVVAAIAGVAVGLDQHFDRKADNETKDAIEAAQNSTGDERVDNTAAAISALKKQYKGRYANLANGGQSFQSALTVNDTYMDTANTSGMLRTEVGWTKMRYDQIDSMEEMVDYYHQLIKLQKMYEEEGVSDDTYRAIKNEIDDLAPAVENYMQIQGLINEVNAESAESFEEMAESVGAPIPTLNSLALALSKAGAEIEAYNKAQEGGEKGDTLNTYKGIYDTAMEHYKAGEYGSTQYQSAMQLLLPDSVLQEIGYDYQKAGELASSEWFAALMAGTEDGGAEFANKLYDMSTRNADGVLGVFDKLGNSIVEITENADGTFGLDIKDFDALGEAIGIDAEVIAALADKIDILNPSLNLSREEILNMAKDAGALTEEVGKFPTIDVEQLFNKIVDGGKRAGKSAQQIESDLYHMQDELTNLDDVNLSVPFAELDSLREKAMEAAQESGETKGALDDLNGAEATPEVGLNTTAFDTAVDRVEKKILTLDGRSVTVHLNTSGNATHGGKGGGFAGGTDHAPAGSALTGEEGPELVLEGNSARIVGQDGPEITTLQEGAKVYTAEETEAILNRKGSRGMPAFWTGGVFSRSAKTSTVAKKSGASRSSKASSAGKSKTSDAQKEQIELHEKKVTLLETELDLLEAQDKPVRDQVSKIKEIQNALLDQIHYMESIGAEQADINKLYVEWYKWNDQIAKLQKEIFDELDDAIDNELDEIKDFYDEQKDAIDEQIDALKEARSTKSDELDLDKKLLAVEEARANLANAQAERTVRMYNAQTGQWEWVANAKNVENAREALQKAEEDLAKYYEDAAYDAQVAALEAQKDALDDEFDSIKAKWQEILDALEEPAKSLEEVLADIARNATDDMATEIKELNAMLAQFGYAIPIGGGGGGKTNARGNNGTKATAIIADALYSAISGGSPTIAGSQMPNSLRYLYESAGAQAMVGGNRIGSQTNTYGNVYTINGVTLTEAQAKTTTIYELAQRSRNLSLYSNAN